MKINMNYCKYENTLMALEQCQETDMFDFDIEDASDDEARAYKILLKKIVALAPDAEQELEEIGD